MSRFSYWKETLEVALDEAGLHGTIPDDKLDQIAGGLEASHENYGLFNGHDCIPNPLESELRREKTSSEKQAKDAELRFEKAMGEKDESIRYLRNIIYDLKQKLEQPR